MISRRDSFQRIYRTETKRGLPPHFGSRSFARPIPLFFLNLPAHLPFQARGAVVGVLADRQEVAVNPTQWLFESGGPSRE
jgi:hypothetical protein